MDAAERMMELEEETHADLATKVRARQLPIVVRMKYGDELYGMRVFEDGVAFHSPSPIPTGRLVELVLCNGTLVVDAEIVACDSIIEELGGFAIRARYLDTSTELHALITEELSRHAPNGAVPARV